MSKRKDRERAKAGQIFRNEPPPFVRQFTCGKCKTAMPEYLVTEHLVECQPNGVTCEVCRNIVPPGKFLEHFNTSHLVDIRK